MRIYMGIDADFILIIDDETPAYRYDNAATQDALNLMHNVRMQCASEPGSGWHMLYRAAIHLEKQQQAYLKGQ